MINRFYFMKTTTELTRGERMYNSVLHCRRSWFRDDKAAFDDMYKSIKDSWEGLIGVIHVTEFRKM